MQMQNNVITDDSASQENMQSTWGKTSFTSSLTLFLNLDFIIEAQIQAPKAAPHQVLFNKKCAFSFIDKLQ